MAACLDQKASFAPRVLIAAEHASFAFGGEAALPLHYYRILRRRGLKVWLLSHARTRSELQQLFPGDDNISYIEDSPLVVALYRLGQRLPERLASITTGFLMRVATQLQQRRQAKRLIKQHGIDVVHQPIPVSPKEPSLLYGLGSPVVIGPMNGGMTFPPAFRSMDGPLTRFVVAFGRASAGVMNWLLPGKRQAAALIVANARTRAALPKSPATVYLIVENGVDLQLWTRTGQRPRPARPHSSFVYVGRLLDLKAVDLLLVAFKAAAEQAPMSLTIVGDGQERRNLEELAARLDLLGEVEQTGLVWFTGWKSQPECAEILSVSDALVLPSLHECGGAVVLEAMAGGLPVIATNWGGPADYLDETCGILVKPESREAFLRGLEVALVKMATQPELRTNLGRAASAKVRKEFDWEIKVDKILDVYKDCVNRQRAVS